MEDYKYTSDGKKVVVVGNLNAQEIIVQEVFCSGGSEFPSGENFVVKSLHDKPSISWKEKELKALEKKYSLLRPDIERNIDRLNKEWRHESKNLKLLIKASKAYQKNIENETFNTLLSFLSGEITHVAVLSYSTYEIVSFMDMIKTDKDERYDGGLKLLTLFGRNDGSFGWRVNRYSDGSGGDKEILPCVSYEDARATLECKIREEIEENKSNNRPVQVNRYMIEAKAKYRLCVPTEEDVKEYHKKDEATMLETIKKEEEKIKERYLKLEEIRSLTK